MTRLSGCTVYLGAQPGPPSFVATQTSSLGQAFLSCPIPIDPVLRGLTIETQGFVLDPNGANFGLLALTAGLRLRIGD